MHGVRWTDPYAWMKDVPRSDSEAIAYIEAENAYTDTVMRHAASFQERLFEEMKARVKETDLAAPVHVDDYFYYSRILEPRRAWTTLFTAARRGVWRHPRKSF
jgi:oligopeptidase B